MKPPSSKDERANQSTEATREGPSRLPIFAGQRAERKNATSECRKQKKRRRYSYTRWTDPQVIVNGVLAVAGIGGLLFYWSQLQEMHQSTEAATKAVKVAEDGIALTKGNARLDQRAWLAAVLNPDFTLENGKPFTVKIVVRNSGKTFAKHVNVFMRSEIVEHGKDVPDFPADDAIELAKIKENAVLPPGMDMPSFLGKKEESEKVLTQSSIDILKEKKAVLYVHGRIGYKDVFGCDHWTAFCAKWDPSTLGFGNCESNNDADNNCLE